MSKSVSVMLTVTIKRQRIHLLLISGQQMHTHNRFSLLSFSLSLSLFFPHHLFYSLCISMWIIQDFAFSIRLLYRQHCSSINELFSRFLYQAICKVKVILAYILKKIFKLMLGYRDSFCMSVLTSNIILLSEIRDQFRSLIRTLHVQERNIV